MPPEEVSGLAAIPPTAPTEPTPPTTPTPPINPTAPPINPTTPPINPIKPEEKPAEVAPVALTDFKIPEGYTLDEKAGGDFLAVLNDKNLTGKDLGQKLLDMQIEREKGLSEKGQADWTALQEQWKEAVKKDPEIGGAKFEETMTNIGRVLDKYKATQETRDAFTMTGAGNNPHIVRFLNSVAKDVIEAQPTVGGPGTDGGDLATKLYTKMGK